MGKRFAIWWVAWSISLAIGILVAGYGVLWMGSLAVGIVTGKPPPAWSGYLGWLTVAAMVAVLGSTFIVWCVGLRGVMKTNPSQAAMMTILQSMAFGLLAFAFQPSITPATIGFTLWTLGFALAGSAILVEGRRLDKTPPRPAASNEAVL